MVKSQKLQKDRGFTVFQVATMSATATIVSFSSLFSLRAKLKDQGDALHPCPNNLKPNLTLKYPRLGISHTTRKATNHVFPVVVSCLVNDNSETDPELEEASVSDESIAGATIDLKLPRRSLLVQFTCDACGERSKRLINRLAYEKGTVYLQCSGCSQYHKLVDNLSLVVEYDLREENSTSSDTDQA